MYDKIYDNTNSLRSILSRIPYMSSDERNIITIPVLSNPASENEIMLNKQTMNSEAVGLITGAIETQAGRQYAAPLDSALTVCPAGKVLSSDIVLHPVSAESWTMKTSSTETSTSTAYVYVPIELIAFDIMLNSDNLYAFGTYTAEKGMTWREWCESEYNTDGCYISEPYSNRGEIVSIEYGGEEYWGPNADDIIEIESGSTYVFEAEW